MTAQFGVKKRESAQEFAGIGTPLAGILWILFAATTWFLMPAYANLSSSSTEVIKEVVIYGRIVCVFSFGLFFESIWTKILQAKGDMKTPMVAQIARAVTNIVLDPLLIFGIAKSIAEFLFQICHESIQPLIRYEVSNVLSLLF